jgi:hypothetical protein
MTGHHWQVSGGITRASGDGSGSRHAAGSPVATADWSPLNRLRFPLAKGFYQLIENVWRRCLGFNYDGVPEIPLIHVSV